MTHPHTLAAVTALNSLRASYPRLADLVEAEAFQRHDVRPRSTPRRDVGERVRERENALLREERADRVHGARQRLAPAGASPAPIRAALLDAQIRAQVTLEMLCWDVAELVRTDAQAGTVRYAGWESRCDYLVDLLVELPPAQAARVARQIVRVDQAVRSAAGIGPDRRRLPGDPPCPACGRDTLRVEVSALDERDWTVTCAPDCRCTGHQCACKRPDREPGLPHLWPLEEYAANHAELRPYLRAMAAVADGGKVIDGWVYCTAAQVANLLGGGLTPTPALLRQWHRRGLVDGWRVGRVAWYRLDHAWTANERRLERTAA